MDELMAQERAQDAERAWSLAKQRGDERLRLAALADYRQALRDLREQRTLVDPREADNLVRAFARPGLLARVEAAQATVETVVSVNGWITEWQAEP